MSAENQHNSEGTGGPKRLFLTSLAALGVVFGDIGTSPLYAFRETFAHSHLGITEASVLPILSIITWSLILVVGIEYLLIVMRAHQNGEGGILTLLSVGFPERLARRRQKTGRIVVLVGVFGAALLFGDGVMTPAISVLSAVEGIEVVAPDLHDFVIPITSLIIIALFWFQSAGTGAVGRFFGPVMLLWFSSLALLGLKGIINNPAIFKALSPHYAILFITQDPILALHVLGGVFLVITGAEALYADMGHFGRKPIALAWGALVFPALLLNYFGQGALLLSDPASIANPLQFLAPTWARIPLLILSTSATIIASQALISGAFSITSQAIQLGYLPRMHIEHTSSEARGQIYIKRVNIALMMLCLAVVWSFKSSSNLAAAYGIGVSLTMVVTSILFFFAARRRWGWTWQRWIILGVFGSIQLTYMTANSLKFFDGGWFPILMGAIVFVVMITWKRGRRSLSKMMEENSLSMETFIENIEQQELARIPGTAIFLSASPGVTPAAMIHNVKHNKILHNRVVFLSIVQDVTPFVSASRKIVLTRLGTNITKVEAHYGFMEHPDVPRLLKKCSEYGLKVDLWNCSFFLSNNSIVPVGKIMPLWQCKLFAFMARNAQNAASFFKIPPSRVIEFAIQIEI
jgi:KUP system potassium uptake protein